jgi:DNA-binding transcriptional LysR family regulator
MQRRTPSVSNTAMHDIKSDPSKRSKRANGREVRSLELRHLKYVVATARNGSFSAASLELNVQQPIVSKRVRELEDELGIPLFDRSTAGARLTPIGEEFIPIAQRILDDVRRLVEHTRASREGKRGQIALGFYKSLSAGDLPVSIHRFQSQYPEIRLELVEAPFTDLIAGIHSGRLDAAIILGDVGRCSTLNCMALRPENLVVALPTTHPLAEKPFVYWSDLKGEQFLISYHDPGPDILNILLSKLAAPSDRPLISCSCLSRESILSLVGAGEGISLQCESATGMTSLGVTFRPVHDGNGATWLGYVACWHPDNKNPVLTTLLDTLRPQA